MISEKQIKKEEEFNAWLESIEFVDDEGKVVEPILTKDDSEGPEGDRS